MNAATVVGFALAVCTIAGCSARPDPVIQRETSEPLDRGIAWLLSRQAKDGGWHSETYGAMRCGVGNTALVVYALSLLPHERRDALQPALERGIEFLVSNLGDASGSADYPTYATALLVSALNRLPSQRWSAQREQMAAYLRRSQQTEHNGWTTNEPDYGGWNQTEAREHRSTQPAQTNVSIASYVLEALSKGDEQNGANKAAALQFLSRCQAPGAAGNDGGGFCFLPIVDHPLNKAGWSPSPGTPSWAYSYGTATADGLAALLFAGVDVEDERLQSAQQWLRRNPGLTVVPGFPPQVDGSEGATGLKFYYFASLARLVQLEPELLPPALSGELRQQLVTLQVADGAWRNPSNFMREDDPLLATSLAVAALARLPASDQ